ncbi:hypothetical protein [Olleya namhaensis]|uniref:DUF2975 domain-containing protein n=1 Tax=Olleya namhaensis TaxID=1144750 RepID=A0A1I3J3H4_9FLAO|nr:hypothetical protein [Olleya namhaensis]SFI54723.1 hypothetical protein SAMN05443431_101233 [Olleya namhaensis]
MKKIRILHWFVVALIVIYFVSFLANIYLAAYTPDFMNFPEEHYQKLIFGYYTQFVGLAISVITFSALFFLEKGLKDTIKNGFFNNNNVIKFKRTGQLFMVSGSLSLIWSITLLIYSNGMTLFSGLSSSALLILVGFGLIILTDFINNGNQLQQENNLTI